MKLSRSDKWYWIIVTLVLIFSFLIRIHSIDRPLLDAHYFRQTQTATVARNFYLSGIDFFHTQLDIFGEGKEKVLLLEFPFYQTVVTLFSYILGFHDYVGRLVSLLFTIISGIFLVKLANNLTGDKKVGFGALVFFLFNPLNYYFQQAYMIESTVIFLYLFSLYLWIKYTEAKHSGWLISAAVITSLAFIHKNIYAPFLLLPVLGILYFRLKIAEFKKFRWLPGVLVSLFVLFAWQYYVNITNFQNGHSNFTLGDASQQLWNFGTIKERFDIQNWMQKLSFIQNSVTKYQWPMFLVGIILLIRKQVENKSILLIWLGSMLLYYLVLFRIQSHDYYFMLVTSIFSLMAAYGLVEFVKLLNNRLKLVKNRLIPAFVILIYLSLFTFKSIQNSKLYFRIDNNMLFRLNTYNSVITGPGKILFVFPQYDWNSVYTYYTGRKGKVFAAKDITSGIIENAAKTGYKYVLVDGVESINEIRNNLKDLLTGYNTLSIQDDLIILEI